jgi:hypothetical protein
MPKWHTILPLFWSARDVERMPELMQEEHGMALHGQTIACSGTM